MKHPDRDDRIDRYVRGELSASEARELAEESLADPELFEELTYSALAKKAVPVAAGSKVIRFWRPGWILAGGTIAAAIALLASTYALRPRPSIPARSAQSPTLDPGRAGQDPVLLAGGLPAGPQRRPEIFRGSVPDARLPKSSGAIVAVEGDTASIDVGSVDGLAKGMELDVYRPDEGTPAGHVRVSSLFRERARASFDGRIRAGDELRIPPVIHLAARMQQVQALSAGGDAGRARSAAEEAVRWAGSAGVPPEAQVEAWNTLAVLRILQGDRAGAEAILQRALAACPHASTCYPQTLNNLGVLSELAGDQRKAREQYGRALQAMAGQATESQQKVIESNLARVAR